MSIWQKLYDYECKECGFQKGLPEFLLDEFRFDMIFSQAVVSEFSKNFEKTVDKF